MKIFKTERCHARPYTQLDYLAALKFYGNPQTMALVADGSFLCNETTIESKLNGYIEDYSIHPTLGWWALVENASSELIGEIGLSRLEETGEVEVGYIMSPDFAGKGFATEACQGAIRHAFENLKLPYLVAVCHPENHPSKRVLEKSGFKQDGTGTFYNRPSLKWRLSRENWKNEIQGVSP